MDSGSVSAIISATAGIGGVLLGNSFVAIKEWFVTRSKRKTETAYLAIIVVSHLDRFASDCLGVAMDDGTEYGRPASGNGQEYAPTTKPPVFRPLEIEVEWKVLPPDLMYLILRMPDLVDQIQSRLARILEFDDDFPDHAEYFWTRRRDFADLGLQVSVLARRLRAHAQMPICEPKQGEWCRDEEFRNVIATIDGERRAYEARVSMSEAMPLDEVSLKC